MQLNKTHKATIASRIMDDVPKIEYHTLIRDYVQASTALVPYVVANLREMGWPKAEEAV